MQINIYDYVKNKLDMIKEIEEHRSLDSVVRMLLLMAGYLDEKTQK
jgi:hypothetical protein